MIEVDKVEVNARVESAWRKAPPELREYIARYAPDFASIDTAEIEQPEVPNWTIYIPIFDPTSSQFRLEDYTSCLSGKRAGDWFTVECQVYAVGNPSSLTVWLPGG